MSLKDVVEATGLAKSHIWGVEEGRSSPSVTVMGKLLECYGLEWAFLDGKCEHEYACKFCGEPAASVEDRIANNVRQYGTSFPPEPRSYA